MNITSVGCISPLGMGIEETYEAFIEAAEILPADNLQAVEFDVNEHVLAPKNYLDRATQLAFCSFDMMSEYAGSEKKYTDVSLYWGSAQGSAQTVQRYYQDVAAKGPRFGKPILFPHTYSNTAISLLAIEYEMGGSHLHFCDGNAAGLSAFVTALDDVNEYGGGAVVGASDAGASEIAATLTLEKKGESGVSVTAWSRAATLDSFFKENPVDLILSIGECHSADTPVIDMAARVGDGGAATALLALCLATYSLHSDKALGINLPAKPRIGIAYNDQNLGSIGVTLAP